MNERNQPLKPVGEGERRVANLNEIEFEPFVNQHGAADGLAYQHDRDRPLGSGFHLYKMEPGYTTIPHQHNGNEEFFIVSGDLTDNDGTVYRAGDLVWMKDGTQHCSYSEHGCVIVVYLPTPETSV
jgi:quercetin dioxygenase-like cupin family protein